MTTTQPVASESVCAVCEGPLMHYSVCRTCETEQASPEQLRANKAAPTNKADDAGEGVSRRCIARLSAPDGQALEGCEYPDCECPPVAPTATVTRDDVEGPETHDEGPWRAVEGALWSDDFTHDVILRIGGDFADDEQKQKYAENLAAQLNSSRPQADSVKSSAPVEQTVDSVDAKRYRWLRDDESQDFIGLLIAPDITSKEIDDAIDAAMEKTK